MAGLHDFYGHRVALIASFMIDMCLKHLLEIRFFFTLCQSSKYFIVVVISQ